MKKSNEREGCSPADSSFLKPSGFSTDCQKEKDDVDYVPLFTCRGCGGTWENGTRAEPLLDYVPCRGKLGFGEGSGSAMFGT